jgi:hypothetical protein
MCDLVPPTPPPDFTGRLRVRPDRRNLASREDLLRRITEEYDEVPDLRLTVPQAGRFFGLREDVCARVFSTLVDDGVLREVAQGTFVRNGRRP